MVPSPRPEPGQPKEVRRVVVLLRAPLNGQAFAPVKASMPNARLFQDKGFLLLVVAVTAALALILWPFFGAVFWATVLAILFMPLYRRLARAMHERRTAAALATEAIIVLLVILPAALITAALLQEGFGIYERMRSGELSLSRLAQAAMSSLPAWATGLLERFGLTNLGAVQERFSAGLSKGLQVFAGGALEMGQNTLDFIVGFFVMLYLLFFLLRDGAELSRSIKEAIPLRRDILQKLAVRFTNVVRATVKGNIVVAATQGFLGGLIFWFFDLHSPVLWGVLMAFLSLLPAVGAALIWLPVAIYFLATGAIWQGIVLIAYGVLVIGLVDNLLRPILVGKDAKLPDYVVLVSTLGGMAIFGLNGFVIGPVIAAMFMAAWHIVATENGREGE
jgi:predicted PurR-regulated permease PerM